MGNKKNRNPALRTTHGLAFEAADWPRTTEFMLFRVGTCHGTWRATFISYEILNVINDQPGNGHFEDVIEWFEYSCRRDGKLLRILEVMNDRLRTHLVNKRGFTSVGPDCVKKFT